MIDPLGPDPTDPALPPRQVGEIVSEIEYAGPIQPRMRHANYDSPEALVRHDDIPAHSSEQERIRIPKNSQPPISKARKPIPVQERVPDRPASPPPPQQPQTALARPTSPLHKASKLGKVIGVAKTVLPLVTKMLPLLEGNVVSAATNLLARPVEVDLKPLEDAISSLQSDQRALAFHAGEQKRAIRRLEDEFITLQEHVQKNAELQAELTEHLAKLAKRTASFNRLVVILLVVLILFTGFLCVRIAYLIRP